MRLLVGVALTLLCVGLEALHHRSPFKAGKRYEYDYYGHFIVGAPDVGHLQHGFSLKSKVKIQVPEQGKLIVEFKNFETATLQEQLPYIDENVIEWDYVAASGQMKEHLEHPIQVSYSNGKVVSFLAQSQDSHDVINIKKALLSLLNVDTSKHANPLPEERSSILRARSNEVGQNDDAVTYTIMEDGIGGHCETNYILESNPWPGNPDGEVRNVTKIKNFRNCVKRPQWIRTSHLPVKCADCSADQQHPVGTTAIIKYDIRVETDELLIEEIRSEGQTVFAPFSSKSNTMFANHSQVLTFIWSDTEAINVPIPDPETHSTLQYKFPTSEFVRNQPSAGITKRPLTPFLTMQKDNPLEEAKKALQELASGISNVASQYDEDTPLKMAQLVRTLRKLIYEEVAEFYQYSNREKIASSDKQKIAVTALSMTGSNPAIMYLKYLIEAREIKGEQALQAVQGFAKNMLEPTHEIVNEILSLAKSKAVQEQPRLYKTTWLTFGIIVNQACDGEENDLPTLPLPPFMDGPYCSNEMERQYLQELNLRLRETQDRENVLLFTRALGLTELPRAADYLSQYASGEAISINDDVIQVAALQAIRDIAKNAPEMVMGIAAKEYYDRDNDNSVRIAAIRAMMASKPDFSDMERLAIFSANHDESDDVAGYVYSLFDSLANSTHYCNQDVAKNAQQLLSLLDKEDDNGIFGSNVYESSQIFEELGMSTQTYVSWTSSNSSILPQNINIRVNNTVAGYSHIPLQINVQARGIQTIINRLVGPQASLLNIKSLQDLFKPESQQEDTSRSNINEKLHLDTRTDDDFFLSAFIKREREARQVYMDYKQFTEAIQAALQSGLSFSDLESGIPIHYHHLSISHEIKRQVPTQLGLPMVVSVADPTIFTVIGKISARFDSSPQVEPGIYPGMLPGRVHIDSNLRISYTSRPIFSFGLYNPFSVTISAAIVTTTSHVFLPLHVNVDLNLLQGKISLTMKPQDAAYQPGETSPTILHLKVKPLILQSSAKSIAHPPKGKIIHSQEPKNIHINLSQKLFGLPLILKGSSEQDWTDYAAFKNRFDSYESTASLINTYWAVPDFSYRHLDVVLAGTSAKDKEVSFTFEYYYIPTPSERLVLSSKRSLKGSFTVFSGFARLPRMCSQSNEPTDSYSYNYYSNDDRTSQPEGQPWLYGYRTAKQGRSSQAIVPYILFPHQRQSDDSEVQPQQPAVTEMHPRRQQISTLQMKFTAVAKSETESKIVATYKLVRNDDTVTDKIDVNLVFTNMPFADQREVVVCSKATIQYPILPCDYDKRMDPKNIGDITADVKINLGQCGEASSFVNIKARAHKSDEQLQVERQKNEWYFQQCQEDLNNGQKLSYACDLAMKEISSLNLLSILVEHSQTPLWLQNVTSKFDNYLKKTMYKQMSNNPIDIHNPTDQIKIAVLFHDEVPALDLTIKKPREETQFRKVYYEDKLPYLQPPNADLSILENTADALTDDSESPTCAIMNKFVNTFDNETYEFDFTDCYHVVAKDCSPYDLFAVSVAKFGEKQKKLMINLLEHIVLVKPAQGGQQLYTVTVDDQTVQATDEQYVVMKGLTDDGKEKVLGHLIKKGQSIVIQAPLHGVEVTFDGQDTEVEVTNLWKGKLCGICGEFRGDTDNSFQGPDQCLYPTPDAFGLSYGIKDFTCHKRQPDNKEKLCYPQSKNNAF